MTASKLEDAFALQLKGAGIGFMREYPFVSDRKFRADFRVWPAGAVDDFGLVRFDAPPSQRSGATVKTALVEIVGVGPQGRHGSWGQVESDSEKACLAAVKGWRVLPITGKMVENGTGLALVEAALGLKPVPVYVKKARRSKVPKVKRSKGLPERVRKAAGL